MLFSALRQENDTEGSVPCVTLCHRILAFVPKGYCNVVSEHNTFFDT